MTLRKTGAVLALLLLAAGPLLSCGETPDARRRSAQPTAEKYIEYVKAGDYAGAYANTMSAGYKSQLDEPTFTRYRQLLSNTTGAIKSSTLVQSGDDTNNGRVRLVYSLECARLTEPAQEILELERDKGEWRIGALDMRVPGQSTPKAGATTPQKLPVPARPPGN